MPQSSKLGIQRHQELWSNAVSKHSLTQWEREKKKPRTRGVDRVKEKRIMNFLTSINYIDAKKSKYILFIKPRIDGKGSKMVCFPFKFHELKNIRRQYHQPVMFVLCHFHLFTVHYGTEQPDCGTSKSRFLTSLGVSERASERESAAELLGHWKKSDFQDVLKHCACVRVIIIQK